MFVLNQLIYVLQTGSQAQKHAEYFPGRFHLENLLHSAPQTWKKIKIYKLQDY